MGIMEDRTTMRIRDFKDAMRIPSIKRALKQLDLPLTNILDLFKHLDVHKLGEVTIPEVRKGIINLKSPASRFDIACLAAKLGGSVTYVSRLEGRTDMLVGTVKELSQT